MIILLHRVRITFMSFPYRTARYTDYVPWIIHEHDFMCFNTLNIYHKYLLTCWTYTFSLTVDGFCRLDLKFIIYLFRKKIVTVRFHGLCTIVMGWWKICNNTGISTVTHHTGIFYSPYWFDIPQFFTPILPGYHEASFHDSIFFTEGGKKLY